MVVAIVRVVRGFRCLPDVALELEMNGASRASERDENNLAIAVIGGSFPA
jgi:hypothetical protein